MPSDQLRAQLQTSLGDGYTLEREVGGGGMSRVFVAQELALGRPVVVKVLPPDMAADVSVDRFRREIQLGAQLQHPNIVPVLTQGASDNLLYYTMPLIDGESLRQRLAGGPPFSSAEAVRLWREIVDALAYAHSRGVVHRDIKPENILLSNGHAEVTDFGIARAVEAATDAQRMTATGLALGTPAYMAPEQAAGEQAVDHRADLYAAGLVMYEMLAGAPAFSARSARELIVAQLTQPAPPLVPRDPSCPPEVIAVVMRCIEKDPAARPATAQEVLATLDAASTPRAGTAAASRKPRGVLLGAVGFIAVIGVAGALAAGARHFMHAAPAAPMDDSLRLKVIIADSRFDGGDSTLANNFAETVISDLAKDPAFMALSPEDVRQWASIEGLPPKSLTRDTLVFLANRGRVSAYLTLGISRAGTGYMLTAAPTGARNDNRLPAVTVAVNGGAELPAAMHRVAAGLRDELLARRAELPFSEMLFTIASISPRAVEPFQRGTAAAQRGDWVTAARAFQDAVDEDSTFGFAWAALASELGNAGLAGSRVLRAESHAYRLRFTNRSSLAQLGVAGDYWLTVGQSDHAVAVYDSVVKLLPNPDRVGLNNEALALGDLRRYDAAIETYRKLIDTSYHLPGALRDTRQARGNIVWPLLATGKVNEARAQAAELHRGHRPDAYSEAADLMVFGGTRAWDALDSLCRGMLQDSTRSTQLEALQFLAASLSAQGRLAASDSAVQRRARVLGEDSPSASLADQMSRASIAARILGDSARARAVIDSALRAANWTRLDPLDRPYADVITAFAAAGALDSARIYASEWARVRTPEFRMVDSLAVVTARGELALASGDPREALRLFHAADVRGCAVCFYPRYARAYDALRMNDSARVWYEKYAAATGSDQALADGLELARTYRRLGELAEERGDFTAALRYYQSFVDLWRKADAPLQPAVSDVKARIARLRARGG